jgi:hypothetical protein
MIGNQIAQNSKPDHPISSKTTIVPGHQHKQGAPKDGSSADELGSSQGRTGPRSETSANNEVKPNTKKIPEEVAAEQNRVQR